MNKTSRIRKAPNIAAQNNSKKNTTLPNKATDNYDANERQLEIEAERWAQKYDELVHKYEEIKEKETIKSSQKYQEKWENTLQDWQTGIQAISRVLKHHGVSISDAERYLMIIKGLKISEKRDEELSEFIYLFFPGALDPRPTINSLTGITEITIVKGGRNFTFRQNDILETLSRALATITEDGREIQDGHPYLELLSNEDPKLKYKKNERAGQLYKAIIKQGTDKTSRQICILIYDLLELFNLQPKPKDIRDIIDDEFKYNRIYKLVKRFLTK